MTNELNKLTPEEAKKIKQDFVSARYFLKIKRSKTINQRMI